MNLVFDIQKEKNIVVYALTGDLMSKSQLEELVSDVTFQIEEGVNAVVLNLEKVRYMNSTGLNVLINIYTQARNKGIEVVLSNLDEKLNKLLLVTKLNSVFKIEDNVETALKNIENKLTYL